MKVAVTSHAVDRYRERVEGAKKIDRESARSIIRHLVETGYSSGIVMPNPNYPDRLAVPFTSGKSVLYLSIGKNTTEFEGDMAVIGVLYEHEITPGKVGTGATIEDIAKLS